MKPHLVCAILGLLVPAAALTQAQSPRSEHRYLERVVLPLQLSDGTSLVADVKRHLGPSGLMVVVGDQIVVQDTASNVRKVKMVVAEAAEVAVGRLVLTCEHIAAREAKRVLDEYFAALRTKGRPMVIIVEETPKTIIVAGTSEQMARAKSHLTKHDVPHHSAPAHHQAEAIFRIYPTSDGKAEVLVKFLREVHGRRPDRKVMALSGNEILVHGPLEFHMDVALALETARAPTTVEAISLKTLKAGKAAEALRHLFGFKGPLVVADEERNALVVRGSRQQLDDVKSALRSLGESAQAATVLTITVDKGNATVLAEELPHALLARGHSVRLVMPGRHDSKIHTSGAASKAMITLVAAGDRLIATCDDPHGIALVREAVDVHTKSRDIEILRLRHATATETARVLDKFFNDKEAPSRLHVVADPATNSLLVKGTLLDLLTVKSMVRKDLDFPADSATAIAGIRVYKLKNASAENMAKILLDFVRTERGLTITHDSRTNSVLVRCPRALEEIIEAVISKLDQD
jgi:type II secretory pathway component GspD/PulD (secretin)